MASAKAIWPGRTHEPDLVILPPGEPLLVDQRVLESRHDGSIA